VLKAAKNFRSILPKCCVTCRHYKDEKEEGNIQSDYQCERGGNTSGDTEDYSRICDYYKQTIIIVVS
jgi:hypothetical protein